MPDSSPLLFAQVVPQVQVGQEVRLRLREPGVALRGGLLLVHRALPGVLDGQRRGDDHDLVHAAVAVGLQDHPAQPRVHGELGELAAQRGEPGASALRGLQRAQFGEQRDAVLDLAAVRAVDERELRDVAEPQRGHLQDDRGQVGAQDLGVGELRAGEEVLLGVQPDADALRDPAATALALVGRRLRDAFDGQALHLGAVAVAGDARGAGVHDVPDPRNRQRGLGDVGRQHHAPPGVRPEHAVLLGRGQPRVQRQDVDGVRTVLGVPAAQVLAQRLGGVADLALPAEEDQDVAGALGAQLVHRVADALDLVAVVGDGVGVIVVVRQRLRLQRPVAHLDRVGAARDLDDGGVVEVPGEALGVDGGGGDDHLQVGAAGQQLPEVAEDEVDVEAALVGLVDDEGVVAAQHPVPLDLGQQDAVGHELDEGVVAGGVGEADLVAHGLAQRAAQLLGDAFGDGARGQSPRLGVADLAEDAPAQLQTDLGQLGGLARTGLPRHDHDLVVAHGGQNVVLLLTDRQLGGVVDHGRR
ncbi:hypothetical protein ABH917_000086 [Thermobifida halotolerans]